MLCGGVGFFAPLQHYKDTLQLHYIVVCGVDCVSYSQWWGNYVLKNRVGVCIFGCLIRIKTDMSVIGITSAVLGAAGAGYGAWKSADEAKKQEAELARQRAAGEAWYNRNYYQDYLNTVEAQNALKRVRNAWDERTREARARQAITGGTPEQAQAVAEAGGEAMGETVGNLAAQGQQNKAAIDAQKLAMDTNLSQQAAQIAENRQQAAQQLMAGGGMITSGLQAIDGGIGYASKDAVKKVADATKEVQNAAMSLKAPEVEVPVGNGLVTPASKSETGGGKLVGWNSNTKKY